MIKPLFLLIFCLFSGATGATALSPSQERSIWEKSLASYNTGQFLAAKKQLLLLVRARPEKSLYWFNLGNSYFMLKDFKRAQICFTKVENLRGPLAPAASLYRAKAMTAQGDASAANNILQSLLNRPNLTPAIREEAQRDLAAGASGGSGESNEALTLYKSGKFARALRVLNRSRPLTDDQQLLKALILIKLDREDRAHEILKGLEGSAPMKNLAATLLDRIRDNYSKPNWLFLEAAGGSNSRSLLLADLGGGVRLWTENLWYLNSGYTLRLRETPDRPEEKTLSHEVRANVGREIGPELFLLSPFYARDSYGGTEIRSTQGLGLRARTGSAKLEVGAEAEWAQDSALDTTFDHLTGTRHRYSITVGRIWSPVYVRGQLNYGKADIGDQVLSATQLIPAAYSEWGPSLRVLWRVRSGLAAEASITHAIRDYATPSLPGPRKREDKETVISARVTKIFSPAFAAYVSWSQDKNTSTLDSSAVNNENFNRTQVLAGIIWDVL